MCIFHWKTKKITKIKKIKNSFACRKKCHVRNRRGSIRFLFFLIFWYQVQWWISIFFFKHTFEVKTYKNPENLQIFQIQNHRRFSIMRIFILNVYNHLLKNAKTVFTTVNRKKLKKKHLKKMSISNHLGGGAGIGGRVIYRQIYIPVRQKILEFVQFMFLPVF